jgi:hypothetical protein
MIGLAIMAVLAGLALGITFFFVFLAGLMVRAGADHGWRCKRPNHTYEK